MLHCTEPTNATRLHAIAHRVTEIAEASDAKQMAEAEAAPCKDCGEPVPPWGGSDVVCVKCGLLNLSSHCEDPGDAAFFQKMADSINFTKEQVETSSLQQPVSEPDEYAIIQDLMGYVQDGSSQSVTLSQDDATRNYTVTVNGKNSYWGYTLKEALTKASS